MQVLLRHMLVTAILLGLFALIGTAMVALMYDATKETIAENQRLMLLRSLNEVVPRQIYDNELSADVISVLSPEWLGDRKPIKVYRARQGDTPVAAVLTPIAPDGYNGAIHLLVAVRVDGSLLGVRVLAHLETPGLGDAIDMARTPWVTSFNGRALGNPDDLGWHVEKDGGVFDQFTGATISPRAVVKAVHHALIYFSKHRDVLFRRTGHTGGSHG